MAKLLIYAPTNEDAEDQINNMTSNDKFFEMDCSGIIQRNGRWIYLQTPENEQLECYQQLPSGWDVRIICGSNENLGRNFDSFDNDGNRSLPSIDAALDALGID